MYDDIMYVCLCIAYIYTYVCIYIYVYVLYSYELYICIFVFRNRPSFCWLIKGFILELFVFMVALLQKKKRVEMKTLLQMVSTFVLSGHQ